MAGIALLIIGTALPRITHGMVQPASGVFVTLCEHMNKEHAINAGVKPHNIICMRELRLQLCAKSCEAPGFNILISNSTETKNRHVLASPSFVFVLQNF